VIEGGKIYGINLEVMAETNQKGEGTVSMGNLIPPSGFLKKNKCLVDDLFLEGI